MNKWGINGDSETATNGPLEKEGVFMRRFIQDLLTVLVLAFLISSLLNGMFVGCSGLLSGAPAPIPKPVRQPGLVEGFYVLHWHGIEYDVVFRRDGTYECAHARRFKVWEGTWKVQGDLIEIRETLAYEGYVEVAKERRGIYVFQVKPFHREGKIWIEPAPAVRRNDQ